MGSAAVTVTEDLYVRVRRFIPLHLLPQADFRRLCDGLVVEEAGKGEVLFRHGEIPRHWVYLLDGRIALESGGILMEEVEGNTDGARFPLAHQVPYNVTARALTPVRYIRVDYDLLRSMDNYQDGTAAAVPKTESASKDWLTRLLKLPVFQQLPASNLQKILSSLEEVEVPAGNRIIEQGAIADCLYIVRSGKCLVSRQPRPNAKEIKLGELQVGDMFGEDALLSGRPRAVNVTAMTESVVLRLRREAFLEWLAEPVLTRISFESAYREVGQDSVWLDVRDPDAFHAFHIEGSQNVPFFSLRMQLGSLSRQRRYITVCQDGKLSAAAAFLLLRYGFEAVVLEGGLESVPHKCLADLKDRDSGDGGPELPRAEAEHGGESSGDLDRLQTELEDLRRENRRLQDQVAELRQERQSLLDQLEAFADQESEASGDSAERQVLEEELQSMRRRVAELESRIRRYQEETDDRSADEIVQALQAELQMVRDQADGDIARLRRQIERLKQKYRQSDQETEVAEPESLLDQLVAVDPEQLPLHSPRASVEAVTRKQALVNAVLWFLVGWLASLALLGIVIQTDTGKRQLADWIQLIPESYPVTDSESQGETPAEPQAQPDPAMPEAFDGEGEAELFAQ